MKDRLTDALKKSTADYADIRVEFDESTSVAYRGRELDSAGSSSYSGGIVRACTKGGWGIVAFDSLENLGGQVKEACRCAALVGREKTDLAEVGPVDAEVRATLVNDFRGVGVDDKLKMIQGYNDIILGAHSSVETSHVSYSDRLRTVHFASTRGNYFMEERPRMTCALSATARDGSLVQRAHESVGSVNDFQELRNLGDLARRVGERAGALLRAPKPEGGAMTVILNPVLAGVFIHEAFGHLSEADFLYENPKMLEAMHVGRKIGARNLNVTDGGAFPGALGSLAFDDEGTPTGKTYLIRDGVLSGYLHSLETAGKMGAAATGNARAVRRDKPPIVRMTNTFIEKGSQTRDEVFAGVDNGIYACGFFGGQTEFEMFTFSAAYAYRIVNGQQGELIRDVTLSGNLFETLHAIDGIADDFAIYQGGGGCGKGGQSPLPVSFGAPHVRIRNVVVGGGQ